VAAGFVAILLLLVLVLVLLVLVLVLVLVLLLVLLLLLLRLLPGYCLYPPSLPGPIFVFHLPRFLYVR
jgi:hypothetical protein